MRIKPEPKYEDILKYNQNVKYEDILEYKEKTEEEKESDYSFGFNLDINRELMTIEGFKIKVFQLVKHGFYSRVFFIT